MKKNCLLKVFGGVIRNSGAINCLGERLDINTYTVPNASDLTEKQKGNIVMKIASTNLWPAEKVKFTELKKEEFKLRLLYGDRL